MSKEMIPVAAETVVRVLTYDAEERGVIPGNPIDAAGGAGLQPCGPGVPPPPGGGMQPGVPGGFGGPPPDMMAAVGPGGPGGFGGQTI